MSVTKIITLTNRGSKAGPYYEVSCSNDCVNYGPCVTTESIYLPTIGSSANVNIFDTTTCIKLVNHNSICNNEVIQSFAASGSTTTTTTTTTTVAPIYRFYNLDIGSGSSIGSGNSFIFTDQFDNTRTISLSTFGNRFYLYAKSGSFNFASVGTSYTLTDIGPSTNIARSYHITAGGGGSTSRIYNYQDVTGNINQILTSGNADNYACAISGAIRQGWPQVTFPYTITQEGTACVTTTTTVAPTTTTTTVASSCRCYSITVTSPTATVEYIDCFDRSRLMAIAYSAPGTYSLCADDLSPNFTGGTGTITMVGGCTDGITCNGLTTTTTTAAPTTTTTTTAAPTTTTTAPITCTYYTFDGNITHASLTAYWTDCAGVAQTQFVPANTTYGPVCARTGTASGQAFTTGGTCGITTTTTAAPSTCNSWKLYTNGNAGDAGCFDYYDCNSNLQNACVDNTADVYICAIGTPTQTSGTGVNASNQGACGAATLSWNYTISGGATGNMDININSSVVESRSSNASGAYTVHVGDIINVTINTYGCSTSPNTVANAYTAGIIADASCATNVTGFTTYSYTVTLADVGTTLTLGCYSSCDGGCV